MHFQDFINKEAVRSWKISRGKKSENLTKIYYSFAICLLQGAELNTTVLRVEAKDADSGSNGDLTYVLSNTKHTPFTLLHNGALVLNSHIHTHKTFNNKYYLYVRAIDSGAPLRQETEAIVEVR